MIIYRNSTHLMHSTAHLHSMSSHSKVGLLRLLANGTVLFTAVTACKWHCAVYCFDTCTFSTSGLSLIKNKAGDRPRPTREKGHYPIFHFFQVNFINPLKLCSNDSRFKFHVFRIRPNFSLSYNKYRYMYFHHWHHLLFTSYRTWTKRTWFQGI